MLERFWRALPWDGLGWHGTSDSDLLEMRLWAARAWRRRYPAPLRPLLRGADRAGWALAAFGRTWRFARALRLRLPATARLYRDCLMSGGDPLDVHVWRELHGSRHPLPARAVALVFSRLGDPAGHALLADKLALAERLSDLGLASPALRAVFRRGGVADPELLTGAESGAGLFLKPRHGSGGRGAFALTRIDGVWRMDGKAAPLPSVLARIGRLIEADDLLVQERVMAAGDLADLASDGRAPVLRLVTACAPGEAPFLHSALLMIARPGHSPHHFLEGMIHAPVDPAAARLAGGRALGEPRRTLDRLGPEGPWLAGRPVPGFSDAVAAALRAMAAVPPLSLVHWDVILTPSGPVMLEGNSAGNWILASLPGVYGLDAGPLTPTLAQWMSAPAPQRTGG